MKSKAIIIHKDLKLVYIGEIENFKENDVYFMGYYITHNYMVKTITLVNKTIHKIKVLTEEQYEKVLYAIEQKHLGFFNDVLSISSKLQLKVPVGESSVLIIYTDDINDFAKMVYGVNYNAEFCHTAYSSELFTIDATVNTSTEQSFLKGFSRTGNINLLCMLCRDGYLDKGVYIIKPS